MTTAEVLTAREIAAEFPETDFSKNIEAAKSSSEVETVIEAGYSGGLKQFRADFFV
jgi:hypothetical protein